MQGWEVEHSSKHVTQRLPSINQLHAIMYEFSGLVTENVHAEDAPILSIKHQLQKAFPRADNYAAGNFLVSCPPNSAIDPLSVRLLLRQANRGDLGDGVDAEWKQLRDAFYIMQAKHVSDGDAALVHAGAAEGGKSDDVADSEDVPRFRPKFAVNFQRFARCWMQARLFAVQLGGVAVAARRIKKHVGLKVESIGAARHNDG